MFFPFITAIYAAAPTMTHQAHPDFPNYFAGQDHPEMIKLLEKDFNSILSRLKLSYVENGKIRDDYFFQKLLEIVKKEDPKAKVYISGGVVRSLLGYIYKKIYYAMQEDKSQSHFYKQSSVEEILERIAEGASSKLAPEVEGVRLFGILPFNQEISPIGVLGVASDLDVLIDFSEKFSDQIKRNALIMKVESFINSAAKYFAIEEGTTLQKIAFPTGDVKEYEAQITRSSRQG